MKNLYKIQDYLTDYWYCLGGFIILGIGGATTAFYNFTNYLPSILVTLSGIVFIVAFIFLILTLVMVIKGLDDRKIEDTTPLIILLIGIFLSLVGGIGIILMIIGHFLLKKSIESMDEA